MSQAYQAQVPQTQRMTKQAALDLYRQWIEPALANVRFHCSPPRCAQQLFDDMRMVQPVLACHGLLCADFAHILSALSSHLEQQQQQHQDPSQAQVPQQARHQRFQHQQHHHQHERLNSYQREHPPRRKNAQVVVVSSVLQEPMVLCQLRSLDMVVMPGHLASIGGMRDQEDTDSRDTAVREVREECGLLIDPAQLRKFAEGAHVDWYAVELRRDAQWVTAVDAHSECSQIEPTVLQLLPSASRRAACFGHVWVPADQLRSVDVDRLPLMGGLVRRVRVAVMTLQTHAATRSKQQTTAQHVTPQLPATF